MEYKFNQLERFSNRVENYIKYRPGYPEQIIDFLKNTGLTSDSVVADIGSGTGISSEMFLKNGNKVIGIEPNKAMREAAETLLKNYPKFESIDGNAEKTGIIENSIDFIVAGQAFHWFDVDNAKKEFKRVLKPSGYVVLIWNEKDNKSEFGIEYEKILDLYGSDYQQVKHANIDKSVFETFFASYQLELFNNYQVFDFDSLKGRLLSSSYIPLEGDENKKMLEQLEELFDKYNLDGKIKFAYTTKVYCGKI